ncbi:MAG: arylamine N-acetyltransferase, partial [Parasporobacterium sp.]|nr:arylamine N-acetyltransferase [Parasporobacterium sp.]
MTNEVTHMYETTYEKFTDEQLDAYLAKLDYKGTRDLTLENLDELIRIHPLHIPFENLNPYYGKPVLLDKDSLFDKIIAHKRGGFCFELNGLFQVLAYSFGFDSYSCAARIIRGDIITPLHHRGTIVHLNDKLYFCDVGFGGDMMPFAVEISTEPTVKQGKTAWCEPVKDGWYVLMTLDAEGQPKPMLMFGTLAMNMNDFNYLCGGML